ncbi:unnamed protein product [Gordionus sp. m RMFG-2023]
MFFIFSFIKNLPYLNQFILRLVRYTKTFTSKCVKRQLVKHHALTFCKTIFTLPHVLPSCDEDTLKDNMPACSDLDPVDKAHQNYSFLLDSDMFSFLVKICLSCHSIFAEKDDCSEDISCQVDLSDHFFLKLLYIAQVVQILLVYGLKSISLPEDEPINVNDGDVMSDKNSTKEAHFIHQLWVQIRKHASGQECQNRCANNEELKDIRLLRHLKISLIPFLRCSAIFFHFLTDIPFPDEPVSNTSPSYFEALCDDLDIPTSFQILFQSAKKRDGEKSSNFVISYPLKTPSLIRLPHEFADLIFSVANFVCPNASASTDKSPKMLRPNFSPAPTLCLVCGTVLCSFCYCCQTDIGVLERGEQTSYDNFKDTILGDNLNPDDNQIPEEERGERTREVPRKGNTIQAVVTKERKSKKERNADGTVGACAAHAYRCGAGIGIFLRIRECQLLFLSGRTKGAYYPHRWKSGNPMILHPGNYENLQKIWLSNLIYNETALSFKPTSKLFPTDWQHL